MSKRVSKRVSERAVVTFGRLHFDNEPRFCLIARLLGLHGGTSTQNVAVLAAVIRVRVIRVSVIRVRVIRFRVGVRI